MFQHLHQQQRVVSSARSHRLVHLSHAAPSAQLQQRLGILHQPQRALLRPAHGHLLEGMLLQGPEEPAAQAVGGVAELREEGQSRLLLVGHEDVDQEGGAKLQEGQIQDPRVPPVPEACVANLCALEELLPQGCLRHQVQGGPSVSVSLLQEC